MLLLISFSVNQSLQECQTLEESKYIPSYHYDIPRRGFYIAFRRPPYYYRPRILLTKAQVWCQNETLSSDLTEKIDNPTSENVEFLEINHTDSAVIPTKMFANISFKFLELRIIEGNIKKIEHDAFEGLSSFLKILSLKNNKIESLDVLNLEKLETLDLSWNQITNLNEQTINNLTNLEYFNLGFNKLTDLSHLIFSNLRNLKTIWLNNNNIKNLPGNIFVNNTKLKTIYLNNNNLTRLLDFGLPAIDVLDCSSNSLRNINMKQFTTIQNFDLSRNGLNSIEISFFNNLLIKEIILNTNGLKRIAKEVFYNLTALEIISLNDNLLEDLDIFEKNKNLKTFSISGNFLSTIPNLPTSLEHFNISRNKIENALNLSYLTHLNTLDISNNKLTAIKFHTLANLKLLNNLFLNDNQIKVLEMGCFKDLVNLKSLDLSNNKISSLNTGIFTFLISLEYLNLSRNNLQVLNATVFHNLKNLQTFNIKFNNITYLSIEDTLSHLTSLKDIDILGNNWSCSILTKLLRNHESVKFREGHNFSVTNVNGVACVVKEIVKNRVDFNIPVKKLDEISSQHTTTNVISIFILLVLILQFLLKPIYEFIYNSNEFRKNFILLHKI